MTDITQSPIQSTEEHGGGYKWYFAYGSNNSYEQLLRRLGNIPPDYFFRKEAAGAEGGGAAAEALPNFGGVHNQSTETAVYPPLAIKVVLLPTHYFVIDAPSAIRGLGYANLCRQTAPEKVTPQHESQRPRCDHANDGTRHATELKHRPPFVVAVAYLLSESQLLMMDKFENAPDKYHRETVRGVVLKDIDPMPTWERTVPEAPPSSDVGNPLLSPSAATAPSPTTQATTVDLSGVISVPSDPKERAAAMETISRIASAFESELSEAFASDAEAIPATTTTPAASLLAERLFRETYLSKLAASLDVVSSQSQQQTTVSRSSLGSSIEGVVYIYEGEGLLHTDVVWNDPKVPYYDVRGSAGAGTDAGAASAKSDAERPPSWHDNTAGSVLMQPSSSYMSRILEGEAFFGPILPKLEGGEGDNAAAVATANKLLAAYITYLRNIEVSPIPSPRTLLRAAGKV